MSDSDTELDSFDDQDEVLQNWHRQETDFLLACESTDSFDNISEHSNDHLLANNGRTSQGRYLCLGDRQRIRELINEHHLAKNEVAKQFNISLNSVKYILSSKCTVNDSTRARNGMDPSTTRSSLADKKRTALDSHLTNWIKAEKGNTVITRARIERQAQIYMKEVHDCDFQPGRKWFQNFRKRCGISIQDIKRSLKQRKLQLTTTDVTEEKVVDWSSSSFSSVDADDSFAGFILPELSLQLPPTSQLDTASPAAAPFYSAELYFPQHSSLHVANHPMLTLETFQHS